jgi:hypothetical protein
MLESINKKTSDGKEMSVRIEEISNGFIIIQSINFYDKKEKRHKWLNKKTYSKENPLANTTIEDDFNESNLKDFNEN